mgnify:CR=1
MEDDKTTEHQRFKGAAHQIFSASLQAVTVQMLREHQERDSKSNPGNAASEGED